MTNINIVVSAQTNSAIKGLNQVTQATKRTGDSVQMAQKRLKSFGGETSRATMMTRKFAMGGLQQAGYQIGDYAVQVANGTSKMQAFGQQAPQLLQIFGPIGAVVGAGVAIFAAFGVALQKSGKEMTNFGAALGVLEQPLTSVVNSVKKLGGMFDGVMSAVVSNIDTALIAAGLLGAFMATRFVTSFAMAASAGGRFAGIMEAVRLQQTLATMSNAKYTASMKAMTIATTASNVALLKLKAAFKAFLPFAVLAGLAKAVEMFLQLRKGAGGFGAALGLLRDVAVESFNRILARGQMMYLKLDNGILSFKNTFINALIPVAKRFDDFVNSIVDKFNSAFPEDGMLSALRIDVSPDFAGNLQSASDEINSTINKNKAKISELDDVLSRPSKSIAAIRDAFRNGATDVNFFGAAVEDAATNGGKKIDEELSPAMKRAVEIGKMVGSSMETAMMSIVDGTKSVKDAFKSMASEIIKELYRIFVVKRITGFITDAIGFISGPKTGNTGTLGLPKFSGGGYTGNGARAGGLDGKGGFMAMMHPRETVVDHTKGQGTGGVTVIQNNTFQSGVTRSEVSALLPKMVEASKAAVLDAKRQGGSYGKAFA